MFPYPINITTLQFAVGTVIVLAAWTFGVYKRPSIKKEQVHIFRLYKLTFLHLLPSPVACLTFVGPLHLQLLAILPLAAVHTLGNLFTNMSLGKVAVSFTHTIKAMEPFFSVLLSALFLGDVRTLTLANMIFLRYDFHAFHDLCR